MKIKESKQKYETYLKKAAKEKESKLWITPMSS